MANCFRSSTQPKGSFQSHPRISEKELLHFKGAWLENATNNGWTPGKEKWVKWGFRDLYPRNWLGAKLAYLRNAVVRKLAYTSTVHDSRREHI